MNILQINSVCGIGSTGRIATDLHALLVSKGHQSTIAFGRDTAKNCTESIRIGSRSDNYLHVACTRLFDAHGFASAFATKAFIAKMRVLNPDVIHLHNVHGYYLHVGLLFEYLKKANKPVIWTLHDSWAFTGHCVYFDSIGCEFWKRGCHHCPAKTEYPGSFFLDGSARNYRLKKEIFTGIPNLTIVTPSKWLSSKVKESYLKAYPVKVINNGIDLNVFRPKPGDFRIRYGLGGQFVLLGVASIWNLRKGLEYIIELSKRLHNDEKIVLVGVNEKQIKKLPAGIIGIARTHSAVDLAEIYSSVDVFVNPTLEEVLGMVNLEAMACGTPVITFSSGGSPECLDEGSGFVVDRGDLNGLVAAIAKVRQQGKMFYTAKCQQHVRNFFDKDTRFEEYVSLYRSCMNT